jgi:hypothetical protein
MIEIVSSFNNSNSNAKETRGKTLKFKDIGGFAEGGVANILQRLFFHHQEKVRKNRYFHSGSFSNPVEPIR